MTHVGWTHAPLFNSLNLLIWSGFYFFTKKVTPIIGVFPSENFPKEKYFSPSNKFFSKKSIFPTLIQSTVTRFSEQAHSQPERSAAKSAKMHVTNILVV